MKGFRDKLRELQVCTARERSRRIPLSDEELGLQDGAVRFRKVRSDLADHLERLMNEFARELDSFTVHRFFFDGHFCIVLSAIDSRLNARGRREGSLSRVQFELVAAPSHRSIQVTCKSTVFNRDLPKASAEARLGSDADREELEHFAEHQMLRFARTWFGARKLYIPETEDAAASP